MSVSENSFTIKLADGCESGTYRVFVKRGDRKKQIGTTYINIVKGIDFTPDAGTTVYGWYRQPTVRCGVLWYRTV